MNDVDRLHWIEWAVTSVVVLSIGMDPMVPLWHAGVRVVPPEFRSISLSASDLALLLLLVYGSMTRNRTVPGTTPAVRRFIAVSGTILVGFLFASAVVAGAPELSVARAAQVLLGLLACLLLTSRPALVNRLLICGAGLILLQLPQLIVQEVTQTSISLGSWLPGWPPITAARVSGALVVFGPGDLRWQRGMGSFLHPNLLGGFLAIWIVLSLPRMAHRDLSGLLFRVAWWVAWTELLLTFSRGALLAAVAGCLWWECTGGRLSQRIRQRVIVWGVPVAASIAFAISLRQIVVPRLDPIAALHSLAATDRLQLLHIALRLIVAHPLLGVGAGNYSLVEAGLPPVATHVQPVHVVPLLVAGEAGIVAGIAWLALVVGVPLVEWRSSRTNMRHRGQRFAVPVVLLILASLDHYFWTFAPGQALFWLTLGMWVIQPYLGTEPEQEGASQSPGCREGLREIAPTMAKAGGAGARPR